MGTNFYVRGWKSTDHMDPKFHIGKRSAAGMYCWDCGGTLHREGEGKVHSSCTIPSHAFCDCQWHKSCPKCGKKPVKETLENSTAGRELGFNKNTPGKKTGVKSCSSFTWAMDPEKFLKRRVIIWDDYGRTFSHDEFLQILEECPIQFYDSIGQWFS